MQIKFRRDTSFRKRFFVPDSFAHPAKMDAQLLIWLIEKYTKPGEVILDPMAGSGTTMLACTLGRHVILVELEGKFVRMMRGYSCDGCLGGYKSQFQDGAWREVLVPAECGREEVHKNHYVQGNWQKVSAMPQLGYQMGECNIIQGDARQLKGLVDRCIFSPPFADQPQPSRTNHGILNHKPDCKCNFCRKNRGNKGAIQGYRQVDKIVTSPPFGEAHSAKGLGVGDGDRADLRDYSYLKTETEGQIGNLPYGEIDKIVTSPPYASPWGVSDDNRPQAAIEREARHKERHPDKFRPPLVSYSDSMSNIGNLPYGEIDKIITSPPFASSIAETTKQEQINHGAAGKNYGEKPKRKHGGHKHGEEAQRQRQEEASKVNIGHINIETRSGVKMDTYLEAMLQVYQQCHKVLKTGGLMILVTKNFIRNKKVVRLDLDTINLCWKAGFDLIDRHSRELPGQSFWRIIYYKKHPEVEQINYEDVLVFWKS